MPDMITMHEYLTIYPGTGEIHELEGMEGNTFRISRQTKVYGKISIIYQGSNNLVSTSPGSLSIDSVKYVLRTLPACALLTIVLFISRKGQS